MNLLKILWLQLKVVSFILKTFYAFFCIQCVLEYCYIFTFASLLITSCKFWMGSKVFAHFYDVFLFECHMVLRFRVWEGFRHVVVIFFSCFWMAWFWNKTFESKFHISKLISKWSLFWVEVQVWSLEVLFIVSNLCFFGCSFVLVVAC